MALIGFSQQRFWPINKIVTVEVGAHAERARAQCPSKHLLIVEGDTKRRPYPLRYERQFFPMPSR